MLRYAVILAALPLIATVAVAEPIQLAWDELIDQSVQDYEDPFSGMDYDNIERLVKIVRLRGGMEALPESDAGRAGAEAKIVELVSELADQGLDADWLISQRWAVTERREKAATLGNPAMDGLEIVISGFAVWSPAVNGSTSLVYLVPERGMCSHTPPPHPNQLIRAELNGDWTPEYMHQPVQLTGRLSIEPSEEVVPIIDGDVVMKATWRLDVQEVETFGRKPATAGGNSAWIEQLRSKLGTKNASVGQ